MTESCRGSWSRRAVYRFDHGVSQRVPLHSFNPLSEPLWSIVEAVEHHVFQSQPAKLRHGIERRSVERDVRDQRERRVALKKSGDRADVHGSVRRWVEDDYADGLSPDE